MRDLTIIIPNWNMGPYLKALFESIVNSELAAVTEEILFVTDKSSDGSESIIDELIRRHGAREPKVRMIQPVARRGLFMARYEGAFAARTKKILFLDSRTQLIPETARFLAREKDNYLGLMCVLKIDTNKNKFCLYWQRSHEAIFRETYRANSRGVTVVDSQNFETHKIGGTGFMCSRDLFVECSRPYLGQSLFSDDTLLMSQMVKYETMTVHPEFVLMWEPRNQTKDFLKHLYYRGPGLAEYHIFHKRGALFYAILAGALYVMLILSMLFVQPLLALSLTFLGLLAAMMSTVFLTRNPKEFITLAPLHAGVIAAYGFGALRGAWIVWKKRARYQGSAIPSMTKE